MQRSVILVSFACLCGVSLQAQSRNILNNSGYDPRGKPELTICTQNLYNYGLYGDVLSRRDGVTQEQLDEQKKQLVWRFLRSECDVIAVQESIGRTIMSAEESLKELVQLLERKTNRAFEIQIAISNDRLSHLAFIYALDRATMLSLSTYRKVELPKLAPRSKPRYFSRGPFEIQLLVKPREEDGKERVVTLINFHFKSRRGLKDDPTALEWETQRMEMAEALRRIVVKRHAASVIRRKNILVLLGDRNSNFDIASSKILEGVLTLDHFKEKGPCRLSSRGVPLCQAMTHDTQLLFDLLTTDPKTKNLQGTYIFNGEYSWLDTILMPSENLSYAWKEYDREGVYDVGLFRKYEEASDHALAYVRLNW